MILSIFYRCQLKFQPSVARWLGTPPYLARGKGLVSADRAAYAARAIAGARLSLATILFEPITVVSHRSKATSFRVCRSCFGPINCPRLRRGSVCPVNDHGHGRACRASASRALGGAAGYRPRVQSTSLHARSCSSTAATEVLAIPLHIGADATLFKKKTREESE